MTAHVQQMDNKTSEKETRGSPTHSLLFGQSRCDRDGHRWSLEPLPHAHLHAFIYATTCISYFFILASILMLGVLQRTITELN
jgi:hypothetical protein